MGVLTRAELRTEIDKNLGSPLKNLTGAALTAYEDRINRHIRLSEIRIARGRSLLELNRADSVSVIVSGTPSSDVIYTDLPANLKDVYSIRWQDGSAGRGHKLTYVNARQWDQMLGMPEEISTGVPRWYTVWRTAAGAWRLEWYPVPNQGATLQRRYSIWPTEMTLDTQTSDFEYADDLIIAWATEWMYRSAGEIEDSDRWKVERIELLGGLILEDAERPDFSVSPLGASDKAGRGAAIDPWTDPFDKGY